ncbi:SAM-dependent methyltransferase [Actinomycetospora straminea]|uniref:Cyclopropane-fatty-acyl-phospholipid synthase family protein n=1 Tax=Actinomycetospora straminea TaxID=663607 RepID=A0ABP9E9V4_9PSEU|nr:cyclopropane-fatty-acyl-phospholipid synthase family protein [Actinomycetospora straminea]MDD7932655.1 cyclopropane-fatty-acyl-phospholipid synthase [Actinomycetospora straminea]
MLPSTRSTALATGRVVPRPAEGVWPGLQDPGENPLRMTVARGLVRAAVKRLPMHLVWPDGSREGDTSGPGLRLIRPDAFFTRLGRLGLIGFGEAWMVGDWDSDDLVGVLRTLTDHVEELVPRPLRGLRRLYDGGQPREEVAADAEVSQENVHRHYDLSNELFALFLDESMMYSAAWFDPARPDEALVDAQHRKIDGILDLAGVRAGQHVLEIGTGWGETAIRAARRGARVTTLTLSVEQAELARVRAERAGVSDRITIDVRDYREATGGFDAVVSVEMIEAVGERFWPEYFATVDRLLAPGGRFGLQSITMPHHRLEATKSSYTWIHKYVFPGGLIPSLEAIDRTLARHTSMAVVDRRSIGLDYAETLRRWRATFLEREPEVRALGFDETFVRMWDFYLAYSEAGFASGYLDDYQLGIARP